MTADTHDTHTKGPEIGGYFGLDLPSSHSNPHSGAIALNSARNALQYVLLARRPRRLHLPSYICNSMLQPLEQAAVDPCFYAIDERLELADLPQLSDGEMLLYVNYFGIKSRHCQRLAGHYGTSLIVDNSQAFYVPPLPGTTTLYSPRKFIGVPDGGYLYLESDPTIPLERDVSSEAGRHLLGRPDESASAYFGDYRQAEQRLAMRPLRKMSALTAAMLDHFDHRRARLVRERNFLFLHAALGASNRLAIDPADIEGPMVYPYWTDDNTLRQSLLEQRIYTATYWDEARSRPSSTQLEASLVEQLVPLPIDQRYSLDEMRLILQVITAGARREDNVDYHDD